MATTYQKKAYICDRRYALHTRQQSILHHQNLSTMDHTTLITILLIAACLGLVVYNFLHKKHIHYNADELKKAVGRIFDDSHSHTVSKKKFLESLKNQYSCTQKDALYLLGMARKLHFVTMTDKEVELVE